MASRATVTFRTKDFLPPDCACKVEESIRELDGVTSVALQPIHERVTVEYDPERVQESEIRERLATCRLPVRNRTGGSGAWRTWRRTGRRACRSSGWRDGRRPRRSG